MFSPQTAPLLHTEPGIIRNFTVFNITTSSVVLKWAEPVGNWFIYRVEWNNGNASMTGTTSQTDFTVENLTPGENYTFALTTVAGDNLTKGKPSVTSVYTSKMMFTVCSFHSLVTCIIVPVYAMKVIVNTKQLQVQLQKICEVNAK